MPSALYHASISPNRLITNLHCQHKSVIWEHNKRKKTPEIRRFSLKIEYIQRFFILALACLETALGFINHINPAFTAHYTAVFMPFLQRLERTFNFHDAEPCG